MEYDRFKKDKKRYLIAMLCLMSSLFLIIFSLFILPQMIWTLHYDVPDFIISWREAFHTRYEISDSLTALMVFLIFFVPGVIVGFIAYFFSNEIDDSLYSIKTVTPEEQSRKATHLLEESGLVFKLVVLSLVVFVIFALLHKLISTTPVVG